MSGSKRNELKSRISKSFQTYYETKPIILSTSETKKIIEDKKQVFANFNDGTYNVEMDVDGRTKGLSTDLSLKPYVYKKEGFECKRPCEFQVSIETNESVIEKNIYTRKGGKICKALIGKKRYRSNFWTKSKIWESDCIDSKSDLNLMKTDLVYRGTYNSQKLANGYKIDETVITRDDTTEVLNQRIPKIIWRALTLPIQGVYYIVLYLF